MSYLSIQNLYKSQDILLFRRCYALEKVHGTSAHISFKADENPKIKFFSGGESHTRFIQLFDYDQLLNGFESLGASSVTVYGEAYGGKQQGMKDTYGPELRFIVFDVEINGLWLNVPEMAKIATEALKLEVVPWVEVSTDLEEIDRERDKPSEVAVRRGMGSDKKREGVVLRPLVELTKNNGDRIITKHKQETFSERATPQKVIDPEKLKVLADAEMAAQEWMTRNRLNNAKSHFKPEEWDVSNMKAILEYLVGDVIKEAVGEVQDTKDLRKALSKKAVELFKGTLKVHTEHA